MSFPYHISNEHIYEKDIKAMGGEFIYSEEDSKKFRFTGKVSLNGMSADVYFMRLSGGQIVLHEYMDRELGLAFHRSYFRALNRDEEYHTYITYRRIKQVLCQLLQIMCVIGVFFAAKKPTMINLYMGGFLIIAFVYFCFRYRYIREVEFDREKYSFDNMFPSDYDEEE